ncbi:hypothetical protein KR215_006241, partial [Drosophila sulfurigaster]
KGATDKTEFQKIGEKYYYIENEKKLSWSYALIACQKKGGYLTSIKNDNERLALALRLRRIPYWVDVNDMETEGRYVSSKTRLEVKYFKWNSLEPSENKGENCVYFDSLYMSKYNCWEKLNFVCEKS